jgi:hypothetical protein
MKTIVRNTVALVAALFCAATVSAQGIKIHKAGGEVIDIAAADLDYIEAYDAAAAAPAFEGTWKMKQLITDRASMVEMWGAMGITYGDAYPEFNAEDVLTFKDGKIIPDLKSNLKNFFIGEATYEIADPAYELRTGMFGQTTTMALLKVKGVNRYFDANNKSADDEAYIGVCLTEDEDADEPGVYFLEVFLIDFVPTSFATEMPDSMYEPQKPVATMTGMYIQFSMNKSK